MPSTLMNLKVLLPFQIFAEKTDVLRIVAETGEGSFGLLPQRLNCVAALSPGILIYETEADGASRKGSGPIVRYGGEGVSDARRERAERSCGHGEIGNRIYSAIRSFST